MNMTPQEYQQYVKQKAPKSPLLKGFVTGMAAKMFLIAGPVIVFGTLASVIYGVVLVLLG